MKRFFAFILSVAVLSSAFAFCASAEGSFVSNNDSVSSEALAEQIEDLFSQLNNKNTCRVYFTVVGTLGGESASGAADRIYNEKGLNQDGDFGVVFVLASADADYYLKVGSGLSDVITTNVAKELLAAFEEQFAQGMIDAGLFALANEICTKLTPLNAPDESSGTSVFLVILLIIVTILFIGVVLFIILYIRAERIRRARRRRLQNPAFQRQYRGR